MNVEVEPRWWPETCGRCGEVLDDGWCPVCDEHERVQVETEWQYG